MSRLKEFKDFAMKGNVVDMAVGVIIGGAAPAPTKDCPFCVCAIPAKATRCPCCTSVVV